LRHDLFCEKFPHYNGANVAGLFGLHLVAGVAVVLGLRRMHLMGGIAGRAHRGVAPAEVLAVVPGGEEQLGFVLELERPGEACNLLSAAAIPLRLVIPVACSSAMIGARSAAVRLARADRAS
jgi:hypothetical protein